MKMLLTIASLAVAGMLSLGCAPAANNGSNSPVVNSVNANESTNATNGAPPKKPATRVGLMELEKRAMEAWKTKDTKTFEDLLTDNFVAIDDNGKRIGKAEVLKMAGRSNCTFKDYSTSNERVFPIGLDAAVIVMEVEADYSCGGKKGPSPVLSASVYVRSGEKDWKSAYHSEVPVINPDPTKPEEPKKPRPAQPAQPAPAASPADTGDELTDSLMALERKGWDAWKERDQKLLEDMTDDQLALVDPLGTLHPSKNDTMSVWIGQNCDIKSFNLSDGKATKLTDDAALLTYKGSADAICNGRSVEPILGTTLFVKSGDTWKAIFVVEAPA